MMPTSSELQAEIAKLKNMGIAAVVLAFGAGFVAGAVLV